jgi:proteasome lid subunit RPN8/RPN11
MLQPKIKDIITRRVKEARGSEVAGYLLEDAIGSQQFFELYNPLAGVGQFFVMKEEYAGLCQYIRKNQCTLLAFVHSHHSGVALSEQDKAEMRESDLPWVVVCFEGDVLQYEVYQAPGIL